VPQSLPIFELPLVLLPGELIPLHIFEERYKRMIGRCLEEGEPFGVVLRDSDGARSVGCTAHVAEVLERFEDGRLNVVVSGGTPFRVLDRFDDPEEPTAEVELVDDDEPAGEAPDAEAARTAFADLAEMAAGERPAEDELAEATAYGLAARVELPAETKQELLQMRDEADRMAMLARVLTTLQKALDKAGDLAERAKSNGRVRIGP
jgi:Lon protease-like protein